MVAQDTRQGLTIIPGSMLEVDDIPWPGLDAADLTILFRIRVERSVPTEVADKIYAEKATPETVADVNRRLQKGEATIRRASFPYTKGLDPTVVATMKAVLGEGQVQNQTGDGPDQERPGDSGWHLRVPRHLQPGSKGFPAGTVKRNKPSPSPSERKGSRSNGGSPPKTSSGVGRVTLPRTCPRCRGAMIPERDWYGEYCTCLSCGYVHENVSSSPIELLEEEEKDHQQRRRNPSHRVDGTTINL